LSELVRLARAVLFAIARASTLAGRPGARAAAPAAIAALVASTALAGSIAADPRALVLQKSDLPPGARLTMKQADKNARLSSYLLSYRFRGRSQMLDLRSWAIVTSPQLAGVLFRQQRADLAGERRVALPPYGDEQIAVLAREDNEGQLWVRKGGTFWGLSVNTAGVGNWGLITRAESVAQLKRYAPKQMKRVGRGG
jgi:hypothetical protein